MTDYPTSVTALSATERAACVSYIRLKARQKMEGINRLPASIRIERQNQIKELQGIAADIEAGEHRK